MSMGHVLSAVRQPPLLPAEQQPRWADHPELARVRRQLAGSPPLAGFGEIRAARRALAAVARGTAMLVQAGDCAESFHECTPSASRAKIETIDRLAARLAAAAGRDVVRIGRLGGQFAKPRSQPTETCAGRELPVFRGHMVNSEVPSRGARQPDPRRMLWAYQASGRVLEAVREYRARLGAAGRSGPWASHEALVLDYESPLVREDPGTGQAYLTSTHLPWIGERTRQPDHAHVDLLASVDNPVACKIGPSADPDTVARLCALLDPGREPGRLTLIVRLGHDAVETVLPGIVRAVRAGGHPVVWVSDPMHGNTLKTADGVKTRYLRHIEAELRAVRDVLRRHGEHPGGVHLEVAAGEVTECVGGAVATEDDLDAHYTTLCDPRLSPAQAGALLDGWLETS
jgi:3-deoxy-7-phosphoheptulonate synthase